MFEKLGSMIESTICDLLDSQDSIESNGAREIENDFAKITDTLLSMGFSQSLIDYEMKRCSEVFDFEYANCSFFDVVLKACLRNRSHKLPKVESRIKPKSILKRPHEAPKDIKGKRKILINSDSLEDIDIIERSIKKRNVNFSLTPFQAHNASDVLFDTQVDLKRDPAAKYPEELYSFYIKACSERKEQPLKRIITTLSKLLDDQKPFTELDLSHCRIDSENILSISDLIYTTKTLKSIKFNHTSLDKHQLLVLLNAIHSSQSFISSLSFANCRSVHNDEMKEICYFVKKNRDLKYLDISGINLDENGLHCLCKAITTYSFDKRETYDTPSKATKSRLETLILDDCALNSRLLGYLTPAIRKSNIKELSLNYNSLGTESARGLLILLPEIEDISLSNLSTKCTERAIRKANDIRITRLSLRNTGIDGDVLIVLANALLTNRSLSSLDVSENNFDNNLESIKLLFSKTLTVNNTLKELNLSKTNLSNENLIRLAEAIPSAKGIEKLLISYNPIGYPGILALSVSLKHNQSLTEIDLLPIKENSRTSLFPIFKTETDVPQQELAKALNDIVIYCQRNKEIALSSQLNNLLLTDKTHEVKSPKEITVDTTSQSSSTIKSITTGIPGSAALNAANPNLMGSMELLNQHFDEMEMTKEMAALLDSEMGEADEFINSPTK